MKLIYQILNPGDSLIDVEWERGGVVSKVFNNARFVSKALGIETVMLVITHLER